MRFGMQDLKNLVNQQTSERISDLPRKEEVKELHVGLSEISSRLAEAERKLKAQLDSQHSPQIPADASLQDLGAVMVDNPLAVTSELASEHQEPQVLSRQIEDCHSHSPKKAEDQGLLSTSTIQHGSQHGNVTLTTAGRKSVVMAGADQPGHPAVMDLGHFKQELEDLRLSIQALQQQVKADSVRMTATEVQMAELGTSTQQQIQSSVSEHALDLSSSVQQIAVLQGSIPGLQTAHQVTNIWKLVAFAALSLLWYGCCCY